MIPFNPWNTEVAIMVLLYDEPTLENKLDLLTEISLAVSNKETFSICEKLRARLCEEKMEGVRENHLSCDGSQSRERSCWTKIGNAINGDV